MLKRLVCVFMLIGLAIGMGSCSRDSGVKKEVLKITYFNGKYADAWIKSAATEYEKKHPDIKIELHASGTIDNEIDHLLKSGENLPDLVFVSKTNWQSWVSQGYLTDLTGMFNSEVEGKKLCDKIQPGLREYCVEENHYWVYPWGDGVTGFLYNAGMFEDNGWKVPKTIGDLNNLITQIKAKNITPFAWSGDNIPDWNYDVTTWWAQYEGYDGIQNYLKMDSPSVYSQQGRLKALQVYNQLMQDPANCVSNPAAIDPKRAVTEFFNGKAAMMPGTSYFLDKAKTSLPDNFDLRIMAVPSVDGAKETDINVSAAMDIAFIPTKAEKPELAKSFLEFLSTDEMLRDFTLKTDSPAPFLYNTENIKGIDKFGTSVLDIWNNSRRVYMYSKNPVYYSGFFDWPYQGSPLMQIYVGDESPESAFDSNYSYAVSHWREQR